MSTGGYEGKTLKSSEGEKLGTIKDVYTDIEGGEPTFVTVNTGLFGGHSSFVPVAQATLQGEDVVVPFNQALVKDAPRVADDGELAPEEEQRLYAHYGMTQGFAGQQTQGLSEGQAQDTSGPNTDSAMTRSEERLHVGTEKVQTGTARLRKFITSETETRTVPVSHQEVRIEREPITDANMGQAMDGPALSTEETEVVLTEERPVVAKETVPVERIRLETETVTDQVQVTEEVRKEQIEADGVYPDDGTVSETERSRTL